MKLLRRNVLRFVRIEFRFRKLRLLSASFTAVFNCFDFTVLTLAEMGFSVAAIADGAAASTVKALAAIKAFVKICRVMGTSFG